MRGIAGQLCQCTCSSHHWYNMANSPVVDVEVRREVLLANYNVAVRWHTGIQGYHTHLSHSFILHA